jgi:1-acyl-sn-glycerol-3-phosphate acyltransferase
MRASGRAPRTYPECVIRAGTDHGHPLFRVGRELAKAATNWHRASLVGAEHLPDGPALLVGNHGLFGLETPVFFYLLYRHTGRVPVGLADRRVFGSPSMRRILHQLGGVPGTRENALALLQAGRWVVCYPGGSREVFKGPDRRYRLSWERAQGFARVAIEAQAPVVPFAGLGVDDTYVNLGHHPLAERLLGRYAVPMAVGLGPLPLPVQLHFRLGRPLYPPAGMEGLADFKARVQAQVEALLEPGTEEHGGLAPQPAGVVP